MYTVRVIHPLKAPQVIPICMSSSNCREASLPAVSTVENQICQQSWRLRTVRSYGMVPVLHTCTCVSMLQSAEYGTFLQMRRYIGWLSMVHCAENGTLCAQYSTVAQYPRTTSWGCDPLTTIPKGKVLYRMDCNCLLHFFCLMPYVSKDKWISNIHIFSLSPCHISFIVPSTPSILLLQNPLMFHVFENMYD